MALERATQGAHRIGPKRDAAGDEGGQPSSAARTNHRAVGRRRHHLGLGTVELAKNAGSGRVARVDRQRRHQQVASRDQLAARWDGLAIEMEGAAVCGVAERLDVPWLIVRALSDRAGEDSLDDFNAFLDTAAAASATVVRRLLPVLAD